MGKKPLSNREKLLVHTVGFSVTDEVYQRLEQMVKDGDCNSIAEAVRRILSGYIINTFYVDDSLNLSMETLSEISSDLKEIGLNINQSTKDFNSSASLDDKLLHSESILEQYCQVGVRVDELLLIVRQLAKKWLQ